MWEVLIGIRRCILYKRFRLKSKIRQSTIDYEFIQISYSIEMRMEY